MLMVADRLHKFPAEVEAMLTHDELAELVAFYALQQDIVIED